MALLKIEGFNAVTTADLTYLGITYATPLISNSEQRNGSGCLEFNGYTDGITFSQVFTDAKFVIGFALKIEGYYSSSAPFLNFRGTADALSLYLDTSGHLVVKAGAATLGTATSALALDTWNYIEFKGEIANSTSIETILVINGTVEITIPTSSDTLSGAGPINGVQFEMGGLASGSFYLDDIYFCDMSGSVNNDFLGDCVVETLMPNGNGYVSDFVGSDADSIDNYLHVDDPTTPDEDSTYIESSTVSDKDAFTFEDLSGEVDIIHGIALTSIAKKDDANPRILEQLARPISTDYSGNEHTLATSYAKYTDIWETNPADSAAWEEADVNGAEFGIEVES